MIDINNNERLENLKCLDEFIQKINEELSGGCMIPISLPKKMSISIIERAKEWFYKNYKDALYSDYFYIPDSVFNTTLFKNTREIELPGPDDLGGGRIFSVNSVNVPGQNISSAITRIGIMDRDFSINKILLGNAPNISYTNVNGDSVLYYIITDYYFDFLHQLLKVPITYDYNRLTRRLKILGHLPPDKLGLILEVFKTIPDCKLFKDEIFFRYVLAYHKKVLGNILTFYDFNLPGDIKINANELKEEAKDEIEKIKEEIDKYSPPDFFFTT